MCNAEAHIMGSVLVNHRPILAVRTFVLKQQRDVHSWLYPLCEYFLRSRIAVAIWKSHVTDNALKRFPPEVSHLCKGVHRRSVNDLDNSDKSNQRQWR